MSGKHDLSCVYGSAQGGCPMETWGLSGIKSIKRNNNNVGLRVVRPSPFLPGHASGSPSDNQVNPRQ